jgi:fatty acyl-CoA reductase
VFTKAMGEMVINSMRGEIPVVTIRPSVIESTWRDPFPGWMEGNRYVRTDCAKFLQSSSTFQLIFTAVICTNFHWRVDEPRMMDPVVLYYGKGQLSGFLADPDGVLDVVISKNNVLHLLSVVKQCICCSC